MVLCYVNTCKETQHENLFCYFSFQHVVISAVFSSCSPLPFISGENVRYHDNCEAEVRNKHSHLCAPKFCQTSWPTWEKHTRQRHIIIGCKKVGHPLSFEESIYGDLELRKLAPLHPELSFAPSLALIRPCFESKVFSVALMATKEPLAHGCLSKWTPSQTQVQHGIT